MYDLKLIQRGGRRKLRKFNPAELKVIKPNRWLPAFQVCHDPERNPVTFPRKFVASLYHHRVSSLVTSFRQSGPHPPSTFPQHSARTVNGVETQPGEKNSFTLLPGRLVAHYVKISRVWGIGSGDQWEWITMGGIDSLKFFYKNSFECWMFWNLKN